jgi:hypothetical protein
MEVGQGPNWGCSAKEKKTHIHPALLSADEKCKINGRRKSRIPAAEIKFLR